MHAVAEIIKEIIRDNMCDDWDDAWELVKYIFPFLVIIFSSCAFIALALRSS